MVSRDSKSDLPLSKYKKHITNGSTETNYIQCFEVNNLSSLRLAAKSNFAPHKAQALLAGKKKP